MHLTIALSLERLLSVAVGQTRSVNVLRFLVRNSIDEKIFDLQVKKNALAKEVAKPLTAKELSDLRAQDILSLLN
jgi:SNF2 family DNA or RNA helicase